MTAAPRKLRRLLWVGLLVVTAVALAVAATTVVSWRRPPLGVVEGQLRPCPDSPNCVSSFEDRKTHHVAALQVHGDPGEALSRLVALMETMPGSSVVEVNGDYARIEFVTPVLRYVDDVALLADDAAGVIHVRSASRVGHSDLGANRERVESIRKRWDALQAAESVE